MTLIDKETVRKEIERRIKFHSGALKTFPELNTVTLTHSAGLEEDKKLLAFLDTLPEQEDSKEQNVNLPKWQKLKNIDSYSDWKIWKDDKVLFVADSEGYLYACSIRELFDKLPKEE